MLEFIEEEISGQIVAFSEKTPFVSYWIDEAVWVHLTVAKPDGNGPRLINYPPFNSLDEAKAAAEKLEGETDE